MVRLHRFFTLQTIVLLISVSSLGSPAVVATATTDSSNNNTTITCSSNNESSSSTNTSVGGVCQQLFNSSSSNKTTITLSNGVELPLFQLGTAQLVEAPNASNFVHSNFIGFLPELTFRQVELALQNNVRALDTAYMYRSQPAIGHVLKEWWNKNGKANNDDRSRDHIWITSKIFHDNMTAAAFGISHMPDLQLLTPAQVSERVRDHFLDSLQELQVESIDCMLLHWPSWPGLGTSNDNRKRRSAAWNVLEDLYTKGFAKAIGVSNFAPKHLEQLKEDGAVITPMVNQFEASLTIQYTDILDYCKHNNIVPQAFSPLGRGKRATDLPKWVYTLANKYNKDVAQLSFRYLYQLGYAITYFTRTASRMVSNPQIFDFQLTNDEMEQLATLNRGNDGGWGLPSPHELE